MRRNTAKRITTWSTNVARITGFATVPVIVAATIAGCGMDTQTDESNARAGNANAKLTLGGERFIFKAYSGCLNIDDGAGFLGAGTGPGGQSTELSATYYADPPGSDLPGGNWALSVIEDGDTPGIATGDELFSTSPGMMRTDGDGFEIVADDSGFRIAGPAEDPAGGRVDSRLAVTCE